MDSLKFLNELRFVRLKKLTLRNCFKRLHKSTIMSETMYATCYEIALNNKIKIASIKTCETKLHLKSRIFQFFKN